MTLRQGFLLGLLAALWGASYLLIKWALEDLSPAGVVCGRTLLAAAVLLAVVGVRGASMRAALRAQVRRPGRALLLGAVAIAIPFGLITFGERAVPSGLAAVLIAASPLWVAVLAPLIDRTETIGGLEAVGLVVGLAGVALIVGVEAVSSAGQLLGALGMVAAAGCYALSSFMVKSTYRGVPPLVTSTLSVTAGALITLPVALATRPLALPGPRASVSLLVLGAGGTALAFVVFYALIGELGAGRAALVTYLAPGFALGYGAALLGERITMAGVAGLGLILAGVALASARPRRRAPQPESAPGEHARVLRVR